MSICSFSITKTANNGTKQTLSFYFPQTFTVSYYTVQSADTEVHHLHMNKTKLVKCIKLNNVSTIPCSNLNTILSKIQSQLPRCFPFSSLLEPVFPPQINLPLTLMGDLLWKKLAFES